MPKQATVTNAQFKKEFNGKMGALYSHSITFDNGESGEYVSKSNPQNKFVEGKSVWYNIEPRDGFPSKITPEQAPEQHSAPQSNGGTVSHSDDRSVSIVRQSSLKAAIETVGLLPESERKRLYEQKELVSTITRIAHAFEKDILRESDEPKAEQPKPAPQPKPVVDDLPF